MALVGVFATGSASAAGPGMKCPGTFHVLHNDKIGALPVPAGYYAIKVKNMTCQSASSNLTQFLSAPQNKLPKGWTLKKAKQKFRNKNGGYSFRISKVGSGGGGGGGGGSTTGKCPGTFRVLHNDKINNLQIPAGNYQIKVKRMTCQSASSNFTQFLSAPQNKLPKGWTLYRSKQKFKSRSQNSAFRIQQVS